MIPHKTINSTKYGSKQVRSTALKWSPNCPFRVLHLYLGWQWEGMDKRFFCFTRSNTRKRTRKVLPEKVKTSIHRLSVRAFIPEPIQWQQCLCFQFGYITSWCGTDKICIYGKPIHDCSLLWDIELCKLWCLKGHKNLTSSYQYRHSLNNDGQYVHLPETQDKRK